MAPPGKLPAMTSLEPVYAGWAVPWCRRLRATTASTALLFTLMNLVPGGSMLGRLVEQAIGIPFWTSAISALLLAASAAALLYFCSLIILQKLAQRQLHRLQNDPKPISRTYLYLRSFDQSKSSIWDHLRRIFDGRLANTSSFSRTGYKMHDPEEEIGEAVASRGLLVAIGDKTRSYGAAKLRVDDAVWQDEFTRFADQAELIFVTPALTEGSKWELLRLFENKDLLQKTIFAMPRNWYSDEWDDLRRAFSSLFALELPEYDAKGGYFVAGRRDAAPRVVEPEAFIASLRQRPTRELISSGSLHFAEV
jgi:hypothetical protein